jgi:large conductance mechanosensitive channel
VLKEFKEFILKGNLVEIAVGLALAVAFTAVVTSFTNDILMQVVGIVTGKPDFSGLTLTINHSEIRYGAFINTVISFLIIGFALFLVIKAYNQMVKVARRSPDEEATEPGEDVLLLREIRDSLRARP